MPTPALRNSNVDPLPVKGLPSRLEAEVDRTSVSQVVQTLADVCREKAQHIRENWQDEGLAKVWDRVATRLELASDNIEV